MTEETGLGEEGLVGLMLYGEAHYTTEPQGTNHEPVGLVVQDGGLQQAAMMTKESTVDKSFHLIVPSLSLL